MNISGTISSIKFRNSENWSVFTIHGQAMGFTGILPAMCEVGSDVECEGEEDQGKYGRQLKCSRIVPITPDVSTDAGVIKILQRLPGIGPAKAQKAVETYGAAEAWRLAKSDPERIGVNSFFAAQAKEKALSLVGSYDTTIYLLSIGLTGYQAAKIYDIYKDAAVQVVSQTPYDLTDVEGFGFRTVDLIALKAGISPGNTARVNACILYLLNDSSDTSGHIWHRGFDLLDTVLETLTETAQKAEVPLAGLPGKDDIRKAIHFLAAEGAVYVEKGRVYSVELLRAEQMVIDFVGMEVVA